MINNPSAYEAAEWLEYALCGLYGAPTMFPGDGDQRGIREAKSLCEVCPVRPECLAAAIERGEQWGIWGGLTAEERKAFRRKQQRGSKSVKNLDLPDVA